MDFRDYIRLLARSWALILGLAVLGAVAGGGFAAVQRPVYESTAKSFLSTPNGQSLAELSAGADYLQGALKGYADLATTAYVLRPVIQELKLGTTPASLRERVQVTAEDEEAVLLVTVGDSDPSRAARVANAITVQLSQAVSDLTRTGAARSSGSVLKLTSVDPALPAASPTSPRPLAIVPLAALIGVVIAVLIGLARELLDTRIRSREDLERLTAAPLLGTTARNPLARSRPLVLQDAESSLQAEDYRTIRTNLRFAQVDSANRSIVITSSDEREGKSTAAANLALAVARLGERVLLVDADLRRPALATMFGVDGSVGLSDVVVGGVERTRAVQSVLGGRLDLLPAGAVPPNPNELLQSASMDQLLGGLREVYDLIVIDSPPLLAVSDAAVLSARAGGAVLVAASARSRRGRIRQALDILGRADARLLGLVLTMVPGRSATVRHGYGLETAVSPERWSSATRQLQERPVARQGQGA